MPGPSRREKPSDLIQSVVRALGLLDKLAEVSAGVTTRDLAEEQHLHISTVHHLLNTLEYCGFVSKRGQRWVLSVDKVIEYHATLQGPNRIDPIALEATHTLADATEETVYLATQVGDDVIVTAVAEGRHAVRVTGVFPGLRGDEHARASGKAILAAQPDDAVEEFLSRRSLRALTGHTITDLDMFRAEITAIRVRGYAIDREEYLDGVVCIAMVIPASPHARSALVVTMPASRYSGSHETVVRELREATRRAVPEPAGVEALG